MDAKLGLIAFANDGGLGAQTRRLYQFLEPAKVLVIDSAEFSPNKQKHLEWYPKDAMVTRGFPSNSEVLAFLEGLTHVFTVENPYNFYLVKAAQERGIKVICQTNYEFCENLAAPWLPVPDVFAMPSYWKLSEMMDRFGEPNVVYLPPPIDESEFEEARVMNQGRFRGARYLHIVGTLATSDRNGTLDLLRALEFSNEPFELIIRSQHQLPEEYYTDDPRVEWVIGNVEKQVDMYKDFDALILPRRYGGLSLTTNEALMSGLPVMMPDISPNTELLPEEWLVPATIKETLQARISIDVHQVDSKELGKKIDEWVNIPPDKELAFELGVQLCSPMSLRSRYNTLLR